MLSNKLKAVINYDDGEWIVTVELDEGSAKVIYQAFSHSDAIKYCEHHGYEISESEITFHTIAETCDSKDTDKSCLYRKEDFFISDYGVF